MQSTPIKGGRPLIQYRPVKLLRGRFGYSAVKKSSKAYATDRGGLIIHLSLGIGYPVFCIDAKEGKDFEYVEGEVLYK
jgi:hypothetical protein